MDMIGFNTTIATMTITRKIETLKKKLSKKKELINNNDLQSFRELCCHEDTHLANLACNAVVQVVKLNNFSLMPAVTWFLSSLQSAKNVNVIVSAIKDLLLLYILRSNETRTDIISCPFDLHAPQHPFIFILKHNNANWSFIEFHTQLMFKSTNRNFVFALLAPLFKYILWSPPGTVNTECKRGIWKFLINDFSLNDISFFVQTVCWLRIDDERSILDAFYFLSDLREINDFAALQKTNVFALFSAQVACNLAKCGYEPELSLRYTKEFVKKYPKITEMVLMIFAETLVSCPISFVNHFLRTSIELIHMNGVIDIMVVWMIICSALPLLMHSLVTLKGIKKTADILFGLCEGKMKICFRESSVSSLIADDLLMQYILSNPSAFKAFVLVRSLENTHATKLLDNVKDFSVLSDVTQKNYMFNLFLSSIFFAREDLDVRLTALDILVKINPGFQLAVILCMLSKTSCSTLQLKLLHSLPLTAVVKENIGPIVQTISTLSSSGESVLIKLSIHLYVALWKIEERCYKFLYDSLMANKIMSPNVDWEMDVVIASAIRDICTLKPELHGKEWIVVLSDILTRYTEQYDCEPLTFSLESIIKLCEANVVDALSVYEELSKLRLFTDKRPQVIEKLCYMIGLIFQKIDNTVFESRKELVIDALSNVWNFITISKHGTSLTPAISALSKFDFEEMPLEVIPEDHRKNLELTIQRTKSFRNDASAKPEDVLSYIPGTVWIDYLRSASEETKSQVCDLLTQWLIQEVKKLNRSFYHSPRGERDSVSTLHNRSIFKALVNYLKKSSRRVTTPEITEDEIEMVIRCLRILSRQTRKSLPPFNWYFLEELYGCKNSNLNDMLFFFFAKECFTSSSAKTCVENYLKKFDVANREYDEIRYVFGVVSALCCGVSSTVIVSFLSSAMKFIFEKLNTSNEANVLYGKVCLYLRDTLKQSNLYEHNCDAICQNLAIWWKNADVESKLFGDLVDVAKEMPLTYVEYFSSVSATENLLTENLYKILRLRCAIAFNDENNPYMWLNECIEATTKLLEDQILYFECTLEVLKKYRFHSNKWEWLLQLLDRIHATTREPTEMKIQNFKCDVFIFSVVNFSAYHPYLSKPTSVDECHLYFPQALQDIIVNETSSQVIEWLAYSCKMKKISDRYLCLFMKALMALKNNKYLQKLSVWSKILAEH